MKKARILAIFALLLASLTIVPEQVLAGGYYRGYYGYHRPYYSPYFYRPYFGGFYYPYFGFGYGYGLGYGYPYGYYDYFGDIRTEVKPNEARVFVDGSYAGEADNFDGWWQRLEVEPGKHRLTFRLAGFIPYVVDVDLVPGQDVHIKYDMAPGRDEIAEQEMRLAPEEYSRQQPGGEGYRYGDPYQRPPRYPYDRRAPYPPDQYDRRAPYPPDSQNDRDEQYNRDDQYDRNDQGQRQYESNTQNLVLSIEPPDATVYIDGNYYGTANGQGRGEIHALLPEGVHSVEVVRPGYNGYSQDINVARDGENRVTIKLQKK